MKHVIGLFGRAMDRWGCASIKFQCLVSAIFGCLVGIVYCVLNRVGLSVLF